MTVEELARGELSPGADEGHPHVDAVGDPGERGEALARVGGVAEPEVADAEVVHDDRAVAGTGDEEVGVVEERQCRGGGTDHGLTVAGASGHDRPQDLEKDPDVWGDHRGAVRHLLAVLDHGVECCQVVSQGVELTCREGQGGSEEPGGHRVRQPVEGNVGERPTQRLAPGADGGRRGRRREDRAKEVPVVRTCRLGEGLHRVVVRGEPQSGGAVRGGAGGGVVPAKQVLEQVAEEHVVAEPPPVGTERGDEPVVPLEPLQGRLARHVGDDGLRQVGRQVLDDARAQEEVADVGCAAVDHLGQEVVGHRPRGPAEGRHVECSCVT